MGWRKKLQLLMPRAGEVSLTGKVTRLVDKQRLEQGVGNISFRVEGTKSVLGGNAEGRTGAVLYGVE